MTIKSCLTGLFGTSIFGGEHWLLIFRQDFLTGIWRPLDRACFSLVELRDIQRTSCSEERRVVMIIIFNFKDISGEIDVPYIYIYIHIYI
jgi:hypothetical protein